MCLTILPETRILASLTPLWALLASNKGRKDYLASITSSEYDSSSGLQKQRFTLIMILTIVRHAESVTNLLPCWGGWGDSPLSAFGIQQAKALGQSFSNTHIDRIVSSDLSRARDTVCYACREREPGILVDFFPLPSLLGGPSL